MNHTNTNSVIDNSIYMSPDTLIKRDMSNDNESPRNIYLSNKINSKIKLPSSSPKSKIKSNNLSSMSRNNSNSLSRGSIMGLKESMISNKQDSFVSDNDMMFNTKKSKEM